MLTSSWVLEEFERGSGEFVKRWSLNGYTDLDAKESLGVEELGFADLYDVPESALDAIANRFHLEIRSDVFEYLLGREADPPE